MPRWSHAEMKNRLPRRYDGAVVDELGQTSDHSVRRHGHSRLNRRRGRVRGDLRIWLILSAALCGLTGSVAAAQGAPGLMAPLAGHPGVTAFDLARLVVTDLKPDGKGGAGGHAVVRFRHIEGKDMLAPPLDDIALGDDAVEVRAIPGESDRLL
jgi:hypothetical protein